MMRRTKILCTLGPASQQPDILREMIRGGMNAVRLNFSHGTHDDHLRRLQLVRKVAREEGRVLCVVGDLQGPKIRVGKLPGGPVTLQAGQEIAFCPEGEAAPSSAIPCSYPSLAQDVQAGHRLLLDDGLMEATALGAEGNCLHCRVITGGLLSEHKGINLPDSEVSSPSLTEKDREDLEFALQNDLDYVALSFVRAAEDVAILKQLITAHGKDTPVIAKLEKPQAIQHLEDIVQVTDAVMVARGDLGVEMSPEQVPIIQKQIIAACNRHGVPVITATQMLESMVSHPRPTRAEASDVANAIFDGTDAVMLSEETAVGQYPVEAVRMMERIILTAEQSHLSTAPADVLVAKASFAGAVAHASCDAAQDVGAKWIVAFTRSGATARIISKHRPQVPILAATTRESTFRRLALIWGVLPVIVPEMNSTDEMLEIVHQAVISTQTVEPGDAVVITASVPVAAHGSTNMMKVHRVEEVA